MIPACLIHAASAERQEPPQECRVRWTGREGMVPIKPPDSDRRAEDRTFRKVSHEFLRPQLMMTQQAAHWPGGPPPSQPNTRVSAKTFITRPALERFLLCLANTRKDNKRQLRTKNPRAEQQTKPGERIDWTDHAGSSSTTYRSKERRSLARPKSRLVRGAPSPPQEDQVESAGKRRL